MIKNTFEELRLTGQLPSPPGVGMRILKLTQGDDVSADEIGRTIMADSALTGRLLKIANSAQAAGQRPVTTVSEATMRLGVRAVRNVALGLSLVSAYRSGGCVAFNYDRYWSLSLSRAVAAHVPAAGGLHPRPARGHRQLGARVRLPERVRGDARAARRQARRAAPRRARALRDRSRRGRHVPPLRVGPARVVRRSRPTLRG